MNGYRQNGQRSYAKDVREYYEHNSAWFALVRRRNHNPAIHRPVWADGIYTRQDALNYVNLQIARQVDILRVTTEPKCLKVLDLGCGFGATIHYLARQFGPTVQAVGMTISPHQAHLARDRAATSALANVHLIEGDFQSVPLVGGVDLVCSVEAFAHAFSPQRYLAEVARLLRPGGRLILCDDFRVSSSPAGNGRAAQRWIELFQKGWHVPHLLTVSDLLTLARQHKLEAVDNIDFSPYLAMRSFPRSMIPLFDAAMTHSGPLTATLESVLGGFALEECLRQGLVQYRFLVLQKMNDD